MPKREQCDVLYREVRQINFVNSTSWEKLRGLIERAKDIAANNNLTIYDHDFQVNY